MKKIRILLYRTVWKLKLKYFFNWLISIRTLSKWSHVEILDPDDGIDIGGTVQDFWNNGTCYTSTLRGSCNGTVSRNASLVLDHPENWDYIEIELTEKQYEVLIWWLDMKVAANMGYSKRDTMKFLVPVHFDDYQRDICSELINNGLVVIQVVLGFGIVSPAKVVKKLTKLGLKVKSLL